MAPTVRAVALLMAVPALTVTFFIVAMVVMAAVTMTRSVPRVTMTLILVTIIVMRTVAVIQQCTQRESRGQWPDDVMIVIGVIVVGANCSARQRQYYQAGGGHDSQFVSWLGKHFYLRYRLIVALL